MASSFDIREYDELATDKNGNVLQAGLEPALKVTQVTTGATKADTTLQPGTRFVFIGGDGITNWKFGAAATASGGGRLVAGEHIFMGIRNKFSNPTYLSVIDDT